jgi:hypothetical protein
VSTHAATSAVTPVSVSEASAASAFLPIESVTLVLICGVLAAGAFFSFPLYDDGWLALALRESGPKILVQHMGDRPIFGLILEHLSSFGSANRLVFVMLNALLWMGFAIESGLLFRKLFPEFRDYSIVAAGLTLAPIVLQTQLSTVVVVIPANGAVILGFAALLILLHGGEKSQSSNLALLCIASLLAASGVALSEYGVATNLVGTVILIGMALLSSVRIVRRQLLISGAWLFALTVAAYLLFAKMADFSARPDVAPAHVVHRGVAKWMEVPFDLVTGVWHAVIGAYAGALSNVTLAWDSKSTFVGLLLGSIIALLFCFGVQRQETAHFNEDRSQPLAFRLLICLIAISAGLLPFSVMGRATTLLEFGSRFRIPIMPVAAAMTVALSLSLVRRRLRWVPAAVFGFLVGYASWTFTYTSIQQSHSIAAPEKALEPFVTSTDGYTVAVVPFNRFESELTANIANAWPVELEKKLWVVGGETARLQFGDRGNCHAPAALDIHVRGLTRAGVLNKILWVEAPPGRPVSVEPYCLRWASLN